MVSSISATSTTAAPQAAAKSPSESPAAAMSGGDFETFLRMLTVQLKNQDPMNPMEGSEFAVQLATFSGVEQQSYTNKLLGELTERIGGSSLTQLSGWIGKEARTTAPVWFADQPLTLDITSDGGADSVVLVTTDAQGRDVLREEIGPGAGQVDWMGRDASGAKLPDGAYSFRTESWAKGEKIAEQKIGAYGLVAEAETTPAGVSLIFKGGASALADEVTAIRSPDR